MSNGEVERFYMEIMNIDDNGDKTAKVIASYDGVKINGKAGGLCSVTCTLEILPLVRYNWGQGNLDLWINTEAYYWEPVGILEYNTPGTHIIQIKLDYPQVKVNQTPPYLNGAN
jgi:hypothetical protein